MGDLIQEMIDGFFRMLFILAIIGFVAGVGLGGFLFWWLFT